MKKILQSVFIMVTVLMILTPAFTMNVRKNQVSSMDNRQLNEFPEFAAGGGVPGFYGKLSVRPDWISGIHDYLVSDIL